MRQSAVIPSLPALVPEDSASWYTFQHRIGDWRTRGKTTPAVYLPGVSGLRVLSRRDRFHYSVNLSPAPMVANLRFL